MEAELAETCGHMKTLNRDGQPFRKNLDSNFLSKSLNQGCYPVYLLTWIEFTIIL